jgi:hypothetical protein
LEKADTFLYFSVIMANSKNKAQTANGQKPNLPERLFWDWNFNKIDWKKHSLAVIDRVIEKGNKEEWKEVVRYYGEAMIINALKKEIKYLPDYAIDDVCGYFHLKKEELACYERKQSRRGHWI